MSETNDKTINKKKLGTFIISNAIVWGAVIIGTALALKGTGYWDKIMPILSGGSIFSIVILPTILMGKKKL